MRVLSSLFLLQGASAFLLPARLAPTAPKVGPLRMSSVEAGPKDIIDTAVSAGSFNTLATALTVRKAEPRSVN